MWRFLLERLAGDVTMTDMKHFHAVMGFFVACNFAISLMRTILLFAQ